MTADELVRENYMPFNEERISLKNDPLGRQSLTAGRTDSLLFILYI